MLALAPTRVLVLIALLSGLAAVGLSYVLAARREPGPPLTRLPIASVLPLEPTPPQAPPPVPAQEPALEPEPTTLPEQRAKLLELIGRHHELSAEQLAAVEKIFAGSPVLGQGNPKLSERAMSRQQCRNVRRAAGNLHAGDPRCGARNMVLMPTADRDAGQAPEACIDQYEFPNVPCEYPVVLATARDAALLCEAIGKRICDAHEWEGACAGSVRPPDLEYAWKAPRLTATYFHNQARERVWAYGSQKNHNLCATGSFKNKGCTGGYRGCGTNTYPAGSFPDCVSPIGVYDQHGNAAEHMNLPLAPEELASAGGHGSTEMKGSWFIFAQYEAHEDDCRWRAPSWHETKVMDRNSHGNYHLGFRCCKNLPAEPPQ